MIDVGICLLGPSIAPIDVVLVSLVLGMYIGEDVLEVMI